MFSLFREQKIGPVTSPVIYGPRPGRRSQYTRKFETIRILQDDARGWSPGS